MVTLFALIPLSAFVIMPELFLSAFGDDFSIGRIPLLVLGVGQFINAFTGSSGVLLTMTENEHIVVGCSGFGVLINILLGIILIPSMHATGAAIAMAVSVTVANLALSIFIFQKLKVIPTAFASLFAKYKFF
jgi:O-antigen/teichoic acid export membrane protein